MGISRPAACAFRIALVALTLGFSGCGTLERLGALIQGDPVPRVDMDELRVFTDPRANLNSPVEFEIVFVKDQDVLAKIAALPASKWFELREDIRRTYPTAIESWRWELVPGQDVSIAGAQLRNKHAYGVLVFANYLTPGEHRARIDSFFKGAIIRLQQKGFTVEPRSAGGRAAVPGAPGLGRAAA